MVEYGARSLEASVYQVGREAEVRDIVVLRDITEQARLDAARRDFIATASHELKTPLFSLSGFMELIDEGELDAETEKEFLSLMRQQVDRLTDLSLSLLDLSQVDSGAVRLEAGDIDMTAVARAVIAEFRPGAESRGVDIEVSAPGRAAGGLRRAPREPGPAGAARQRRQVLTPGRDGRPSAWPPSATATATTTS